MLAIEKAVAGPAVVQRPAAQGVSDAARAGLSATARTGVLWGTLLLGVGVLALLSWRMVRQPALAANNEGDDAERGERPPT